VIRALIVEDSPLARQGIRLYLREEQDVVVVGEAADGPEAVANILALRPDLVFLDVNMPGFGGFDVLKRTREANLRAVIFVTAHADYALEAFNNDAVSYLLKPINPQRFAQAVQRARLLLRDTGGASGEAAAQARDVEAPSERSGGIVGAQLDASRHLTRLLVRHAERFLLLRTDEIHWISSANEYATLHTTRGDWLLRMPITELAARLDPGQFARIHRGTIVNLDRVREIQPRSHGDYDVVLEDGTELRLSRSYRAGIFGRAE
jgi:two-component system LytT family response regulator